MAHRGGDGLKPAPMQQTSPFTHAHAHTCMRGHQTQSTGTTTGHFGGGMRTHKSPPPPDDKREATASLTGSCHCHCYVARKFSFKWGRSFGTFPITTNCQKIWSSFTVMDHFQFVHQYCGVLRPGFTVIVFPGQKAHTHHV